MYLIVIVHSLKMLNSLVYFKNIDKLSIKKEDKASRQIKSPVKKYLHKNNNHKNNKKRKKSHPKIKSSYNNKLVCTQMHVKNFLKIIIIKTICKLREKKS